MKCGDGCVFASRPPSISGPPGPNWSLGGQSDAILGVQRSEVEVT